jgi:hypothetical protein
MPATPPASLQAHARHPARGTRLPNAALSPGPRIREQDARTRQHVAPAVNLAINEEEDEQGNEESEIDEDGEDHAGRSDDEGLADEEEESAGEETTKRLRFPQTLPTMAVRMLVQRTKRPNTDSLLFSSADGS